jgi:hypothetical protein
MLAIRSTAAAIAVGLIALALAACGSSDMETGPALEEANKAFADLGVTIACPDTVDPAAEFTCTLKGPGGEGIEVQMKVVEQDGEKALDTVDQGAFEEALMKAAGTDQDAG